MIDVEMSFAAIQQERARTAGARRRVGAARVVRPKRGATEVRWMPRVLASIFASALERTRVRRPLASVEEQS
jgi:hypothetical protein